MLSSPMNATTKKVYGFTFGTSRPASPELREIPSPRCGEPLSACLPSLCLALADQQTRLLPMDESQYDQPSLGHNFGFCGKIATVV